MKQASVAKWCVSSEIEIPEIINIPTPLSLKFYIGTTCVLSLF